MVVEGRFAKIFRFRADLLTLAHSAQTQGIAGRYMVGVQDVITPVNLAS